MTRPEDSCPLVPKGFGAPKFPECCQDKFLANEDENAYVQLEIYGDPAPTVTWLKDELDLCGLDRFKSWTDGKKGLAFLGVENAQKEDEGIYRCLIKNRFGKREHKFKLFIARSWQERKGPPKREVPIYWSEVPRSKFTKEGLLDKISFTAKLTVADKSAKWFFNNQECVDQNKYEIQKVGSSFTITILGLEHADTGCYRCTLNEVDLSCETYLDVQLPDPEYSFLKPLVPLVSGYTGRQIKISCLSSQDAQVIWSLDKKEINDKNPYFKINQNQGDHDLCITNPRLEDAGVYTCRIKKFGKEGADSTTCKINIEEFPHKFSKRLESSIDATEMEDIILQVITEEKNGTVSWFKDDKEILIERKRHQRLFLLSKDWTHQLRIENSKIEDSGLYTVKTNKDSSSCTVHVQEYPHLLSTRLPEEVTVLEGQRVHLEIRTQDEQAKVDWVLNGNKIQPERSRLARLQVQVSGCVRSLTIKKAEPCDSGCLRVSTNKDSSQTQLKIKCQNDFTKRLEESVNFSENSKAELYVQVRDIYAPVSFYIDRMLLEEEDGRIEIENNGLGQYLLRFLKVRLEDAGLLCAKTPSNRGEEMLQCKCIFNVSPCESAPILGPADPVTCVAILHSFSDRMNSYIQKEQCRIIIPYKIEGARLSTVDILVEKDGYELEVGNEIQMRVMTDKIQIDVINPQRSNSGLYKVTMSNDEGSASIQVPVLVLDIPSSPVSCTIPQVFKDSVTVQWTPPTDDGGCSIKHYIVESLDFTTSNIWSTVAMSESGDENEFVVRNLIEGHRYVFRVSAANKIGQSEPTEYKGSIVTKDPWEVPGECGRVSVEDWTPTFADLVWSAPASDGGTPILSYLIQFKERSMRDWLDAVEIPIQEIEYSGTEVRGRCENLTEEYEYRFRVIAINRSGQSRPSPASAPVIAMHKHIPPSIKGGGLEDLRLKEGRSFRFDVWVAGEPPPSIEWFRNDTKLVNDDLTSISIYTKNASVYSLKNAVLSIPKALEESHDGVYKLRLRNESGVFESISKVEIEGPPGRKKALEQIKEEEKEVDDDIEEVFNDKLPDPKIDAKDEDKDSGLKIEEESNIGSEEDYDWTEYSEEENSSDQDNLKNEKTHVEDEFILTENKLESDDHDYENSKTITDALKTEDQDHGNNNEISDALKCDDHDYDNNNKITDESFIPEANVNYDMKQLQIEDNNYSNEPFSNGVSTAVESKTFLKELTSNNLNTCDQITCEENETCHPSESLTQQTSNGRDHETYTKEEISSNYVSINNEDEGTTKNYDEYENMSLEAKDKLAHTENLCDSQCKQVENHSNIAEALTESVISPDINIPQFTVNEKNLNRDNSGVNENCSILNIANISFEENSPTKTRYLDNEQVSESNVNTPLPGDSLEIGNLNTDPCHPPDNIQESGIKSPRDCGEKCEKSQYTGKSLTLELNDPESTESMQMHTNSAQLQDNVDKNTSQSVKTRKDSLAEWAKIENEKRQAQLIKDREKELEKQKQEKDLKRLQLEKSELVSSLKLQLYSRLEHLGFSPSSGVQDFKFDNGDSCLMSLLDQMNRDDQDFKVWERDDYSFLRWYVTKQMETHITKNTQLPFIKMINGNPLEYVEHISEDYVPLDDIFLSAAAVIFNKDIIIVPAVEDEEVRVLYGGPGSTKGKGAPLYMGCIETEHEIPPQYYSILPKENCNSNFVYGEASDRKVSIYQNREERREKRQPRGWKRMDSYSGSASKDLESMINEIVKDENLEDLFDKLDQCDDSEDESQPDAVTKTTEIENKRNLTDTYGIDNSIDEVSEIKNQKIIDDYNTNSSNIENTLETEDTLNNSKDDLADCDNFSQSTLTQDQSWNQEKLNNGNHISEDMILESNCNLTPKAENMIIKRKIKITASETKGGTESFTDQVKDLSLHEETPLNNKYVDDPNCIIAEEQQNTSEAQHCLDLELISEVVENTSDSNLTTILAKHKNLEIFEAVNYNEKNEKVLDNSFELGSMSEFQENKRISPSEIISENVCEQTEKKAISVDVVNNDDVVSQLTVENQSVSSETEQGVKNGQMLNENNMIIDKNNEDKAEKVIMRQKKYSRRKSTASFRWSGVEMCQVDGTPTCQSSISAPEPASPVSPTKSPQSINTEDLINLKSSLSMKVQEYGLQISRTEEGKCKDSCLVALLDQMHSPGQDFKVWDKDDHPFLYWYICKQMDIQISNGTAANFLHIGEEHTPELAKQFQADNIQTNEYFLRAFSRIFNKDIVIVSSDKAECIRSGTDLKELKNPLIFGKLEDSNSGSELFLSLVPGEENSTLINSLYNTLL